MFRICDGLARLLAPILPVTADDLWRNLPGHARESVHLEQFADVARFIDRELMGTLGTAARRSRRRQRGARGEAQDEGDRHVARRTGRRLCVSGPIAALLEQHRDDLPMLFIVSEVDAARRRDATGADDGRAIHGRARRRR